jgi:hypothetical protein
MEVHPPHHPLHTWRDFFVHIGTITVGLLIAIGLEQTVEAIHHHRELVELRESLRHDAEKGIVDSQRAETTLTAEAQWLETRLAQVHEAIDRHKPLPAIGPPAISSSSFDQPADPAWNAAKTSGLLSLMPQDEVKAFSEMDALIATTFAAIQSWIQAWFNRLRFEQEYATPSQSLSTASPEELRHYLDLLRQEDSFCYTGIFLSQFVRGGETGILQGTRDLEGIQKAERQFSK